MRDSVLDAIKQGRLDFEPEHIGNDDFDSTEALPGSSEKVRKIAERVQIGLPLWHSDDRLSFDDSQDAMD